MIIIIYKDVGFFFRNGDNEDCFLNGDKNEKVNEPNYTFKY